MANLQYDKTFVRRNLIRFYGLLVVGIVLSQCWPWPTFGYRIMAAAVGIGLGFGIASIFEKAAVWLYRCPQCRERIGQSPYNFSKWDKIVLRCSACEIDWDLCIEPPRDDTDDRDPWTGLG